MVAVATDNLLYHYTSEAGLQGVIGNDVIWATDIHFLNDWTEFKQLFTEHSVKRLLDAYIDGLPQDLNADAKKVVVAGVFAERNFQALLNIIESRPPYGQPTEAFVCSFSTDGGDRLSQWRGYSHSSQGFSLGFDPALLKKQIGVLNTPEIPTELVECIYAEATMVQHLTDLGKIASAGFLDLRQKREPVPDWFRTELQSASPDYRSTSWYLLKALTMASTRFFRAAAQFKHPGFSEERESRIVCFGFRNTLLSKSRIKFRNGQFGLTPYIEVPLGLHKPDICSLRRVVIGPGPRDQSDRNAVQSAVEMLLQRHGIPLRSSTTPNGVEILASDIPFRAA